MIFKRMREQILDKAIRGQLVPQLAEDGVVDQIGEAPAEVPFEIPQSWKWGTLENYVTINPSTSKLDDNTEVSFLPMASVYPGFVSKFDREESKLWVNAKKGFSKFANGDVLLAKISPCFENRKSCIVHNLINGFGAGSTELIAMRPTELIYANYLLWYVKTKYVIDYCSITFKGTVGQQRINPDRFKSMPIPVPPLAEQKRIASKIESLFGEIDCAEKAYEELQSLANVLRGQILQKAIQGKLVPQLPEDGVVDQIGDVPAELPFEIPDSWKWGLLENYVTINPSTSKLDDNTEVSFLPMASVYPGFVNNFDREESKLWVNAKKGFSKFANGDVLIAKISPCFENRKSCIVRDLINGFGAGSTELIAMRPTDLIYAEYLLWYVKTKYVIDYCSITFKGTVGQQRINPDRFKSMPIPVPPLAEQKRIVAKVNALFEQIDLMTK